MPFEDELQKASRGVVEKLPVTIREDMLDPMTSATNRLKYVDMAFQLFNGPVGRLATDLDTKNAREAAVMLREVVPELERIRDGHRSEKLRRKADRYLKFIAFRIERHWPEVSTR